MTVLYNLAKVATATTGTGTITLGSAVSGYLTFAQSGVQNGDVVAYGIRDGVNSEVGTGTYSSTGPTLTRSVTKSTNSNNPISLSGSAEVYITARGEDIVNKTGDTMTGALTLLNTGLKVLDTDASHTLSIIPGTNLTADRTLTWTTGDTSRNITLTGNTTIPATFPTVTTDNTVPRFDGAAGSFQTSGVAIDDSNNVTGVLSIDIGGTDTTITKASSGVIAVEGSNVLMASNIGSSVQAYSANLASLSSVYTAPTTVTSAQFNLLEATNNGTNYLTLLPPTSIASNKNVSFQDVAGTVYVSNGTDVAVADGGTGASSASDARTNLGCGDGTVTGSGSLVLANSPTLSTPTLGTPLSGTLTNCTGLPISTGVSGLGANVATFLATPSSANLASAVTDETGSGALVFATSPTLTTPIVTQLNGGQLAGFRNKIINGAMEIAQRGTSFAAAANGAYTLDRFQIGYVSTAVSTVSQDTASVPSTNEFQYALKVAVTTADTSIAATDIYGMNQFIEGYNVRDLIGKTFTLSFWVRSSKTGTHCIGFKNSVSDRSYILEYTVNSANTWEYKSVTVTNGLITAGTWNWTNGIGLSVTWVMMAGSNFQTTTGAWQTGNFLATANQVNCVDTIGNIFAITGAQLEVGDTATPFEHRPIGTELALSQRYYLTSKGILFASPGGGSSNFPVTMRATPTVVTTGSIDVGSGGTWVALSANGVSQNTLNSAISGAAYTASAEL